MRQASVEPLALNPDGSLVQLEAGSWFVCFVPGIEKQWWHPFVHRTHKHVFAIRPIGHDEWTVFEPWWTRLLTATIGTAQAMRFLQWGAEGDVLLVRESIPGHGSQLRGWMNCAALATYLLGRPYRVWTPHGLYRRLLKEPNVCRVDVTALTARDLSTLGSGSRVVEACDHCGGGRAGEHVVRQEFRQEGARKPFCLHCCRDLPRPDRSRAGRLTEAHQPPGDRDESVGGD